MDSRSTRSVAVTLPDCCSLTQLGLPRPQSLTLDVSMQTGSGLYWDLGMERWNVQLVAHWPDGDALLDAVSNHLGVRPRSVRKALKDHGVSLDAGGVGRIGQVDAITARISNPLAETSGRRVTSIAPDLHNAAERLPSDVARILHAIAAKSHEPRPLWSAELMEQSPTALFADLLLMLSSLQITPVMRGQGLGGWLAAQAVSMFSSSQTLVAAAIPVARPYEDESWLTEPPEKLFSTSRPRLRDLNDFRFARHWRDALGLRPLPNDPTVLAFYTWDKHEKMNATIKRWSKPGWG